jgi:hypothetical protein
MLVVLITICFTLVILFFAFGVVHITYELKMARLLGHLKDVQPERWQHLSGLLPWDCTYISSDEDMQDKTVCEYKTNMRVLKKWRGQLVAAFVIGLLLEVLLGISSRYLLHMK